jgi:hypothetical protein
VKYIGKRLIDVDQSNLQEGELEWVKRDLKKFDFLFKFLSHLDYIGQLK